MEVEGVKLANRMRIWHHACNCVAKIWAFEMLSSLTHSLPRSTVPTLLLYVLLGTEYGILCTDIWGSNTRETPLPSQFPSVPESGYWRSQLTMTIRTLHNHKELPTVQAEQQVMTCLQWREPAP